ncbi:DUF397 domain-containing protein [Actinomadura terrae]|uniref:DUF397 domain-containing protein n=1 Tax=Actinomadura terrae TaxID=604353 RepID=UPI003558A38A
MVTLPENGDHWHVGTSRLGNWEIFPERHDRATAMRRLRNLLTSDGQATRNPGYAAAMAVLDRGYSSCRVGARSYVAFACACPLLPKEEINRKEEMMFQRSSHCDGMRQPGCIEMAGGPDFVALRDSSDPTGQILYLTHQQWRGVSWRLQRVR